MNINEENKPIDDAFRKGIERLELPPIPINIDGIRADTLQLQLARSITQNQWLKGIAGLLLLFLGGLGLKTYQQALRLSDFYVHEKYVHITKTDTVYLTKIQKVYIPVKVLLDKEQEDTGPYEEKRYQEAKDLQEKQNTNEIIRNGENFTLKNIEHTKRLIGDKILPKERMYFNEVTNYKPNENLSSVMRDSSALILDEQKVLTENGPIVDSKKISLAFLKSLPLQYVNTQLQVTKILGLGYLFHESNNTKKIVKPQEIPILNRLSLSAHYGPEITGETILKDQIEAFSYGNENISSTKTWGLRIGLKLNKKWRLSMGYEDVDYTFDSHEAKNISLKAELLAGQPTFLYRTIFGMAQIPNSVLNKTPQVGDELLIESEEEHIAGYARIPIILRYDFLNKNIVVGNRLYGGLTFYGLMGGVYSIPAHQALKVEVYEFNPNREYNMMLSTFSNNLNTWGITMGLGAEYELNNKWGLWVEPTYHRLLTSMVANMPLRTYTSSIGVKFGISYYFGNPPKVQRRK